MSNLALILKRVKWIYVFTAQRVPHTRLSVQMLTKRKPLSFKDQPFELCICVSAMIAHTQPVYAPGPSPHPCAQTHTPAESSSTIHRDKGKELSAGYKASTGSQSVSSTVLSADCSSLS